MPINFKSFLDFSWMSQASYLDLQDLAINSADLVTKLQTDTFAQDKRFAEKQALAFTNTTTGYSFISQLPKKKKRGQVLKYQFSVWVEHGASAAA